MKIDIDRDRIPPPLTDDCCCGIGKYVYVPLKDVPISFFEWMVRITQEAPRVARSPQWTRVLKYIHSKK